MNKSEMVDKLAHELTKQLTDEGKLVEAGFAVFKLFCIPGDAPPNQIEFLRLAFMAGAEHLLFSIMNTLDPGEEITPDDDRRMELIVKELDQWRARLVMTVDPPKGTA